MSGPVAAAEARPVAWVGYEGPGPQRRLTVAFRLVLAVPHLLYAGVLALVASVLVVIGWFAALFTGRLPRGIADFLARVVEYVTQVHAYGYMLMTDRYPPFELGRSDYAVSVDVPRDVELNRAAVLFRAVLMIPAGLVVTLLLNGLGVVVVLAWLLTLMMGRLPVPLFEAFAAVLRYEVRFYAYAAMLTSEYPRRLFGDRAGEGAPGADPDPSSTPKIAALVLSRGAKWIVGLMLALGVLFGVAVNLVAIASIDTETADRLEQSYTRLEDAQRRYSLATQRCALGGGLECLHEANRELAGAVRSFQSDLRSLQYSEIAIEDAEEVDRDATEMIRTLEQLASTTDPSQYDRLLEQLDGQAEELDEDFATLYEAAFFQ